MLPRLVPRLVITALLLVAGCSMPPPSGALSEADKNALLAINETFAQSVQANNWAAVAATYAGDASLMPPNGPEVKGRDMIQAWFEALPPVTEFTIEPQEINGVGDLAYVRGAYTISFILPGTPGPIEDRGKYLVIQRKQADGSWLRTHDIFNSDVTLGVTLTVITRPGAQVFLIPLDSLGLRCAPPGGHLVGEADRSGQLRLERLPQISRHVVAKFGDTLFTRRWMVDTDVVNLNEQMPLQCQKRTQ